MKKPLRTCLDPDRIKELHRQGYKLAQIGRLMANEEGRRVPYCATAISYALRVATGQYRIVENAKRQKVYEQIPPPAGQTQED